MSAAHVSTAAAMAPAGESRRCRRKRSYETDCANCLEFRHYFTSCFPEKERAAAADVPDLTALSCGH
jgi:hypothetical protein